MSDVIDRLRTTHVATVLVGAASIFAWASYIDPEGLEQTYSEVLVFYRAFENLYEDEFCRTSLPRNMDSAVYSELHQSVFDSIFVMDPWLVTPFDDDYELRVAIDVTDKPDAEKADILREASWSHLVNGREYAFVSPGTRVFELEFPEVQFVDLPEIDRDQSVEKHWRFLHFHDNRSPRSMRPVPDLVGTSLEEVVSWNRRQIGDLRETMAASDHADISLVGFLSASDIGQTAAKSYTDPTLAVLAIKEPPYENVSSSTVVDLRVFSPESLRELRKRVSAVGESIGHCGGRSRLSAEIAQIGKDYESLHELFKRLRVDADDEFFVDGEVEYDENSGGWVPARRDPVVEELVPDRWRQYGLGLLTPREALDHMRTLRSSREYSLTIGNLQMPFAIAFVAIPLLQVIAGLYLLVWLSILDPSRYDGRRPMWIPLLDQPVANLLTMSIGFCVPVLGPILLVAGTVSQAPFYLSAIAGALCLLLFLVGTVAAWKTHRLRRDFAVQ